jgi:hypothetical protein
MKANHAKTDDNLWEMKEEMLAKMEANQGKMMANLDAHHKRMMANMDSQPKKMDACLGRLRPWIWRQIHKKWIPRWCMRRSLKRSG